MKIAVHTLGCKVNQAESASLEKEIVKRGHVPAPFGGDADVFIINTCCVTGASGMKSRGAVRRARRSNPAAIIAVCGCYSQLEPDAALELGADIVTGSGDKPGLLDKIENAVAGRPYADLSPLTGGRLGYAESGGAGRTRALLKIEDGCGNRCSYCIIPAVRGPVRSLEAADAALEAKRLSSEGFLEIVITGVEICSWGADLPGRPPLIGLIEAVSRAAEGSRIRLGSLEPAAIDADFCKRLAALKNVCPHFHLPLQSGSDRILALMRRKYNRAGYRRALDALTEYHPEASVTTDLIVGFPGETDADFEDSLSFAEGCGFSKTHIFPYSSRTGTDAANMPGRLSNRAKSGRCARAAEAARASADRLRAACIGKIMEVLFESNDGKLWRGHAGNYMEVAAAGNGLQNCLRRVRIDGADGEILLGTVL